MTSTSAPSPTARKRCWRCRAASEDRRSRGARSCEIGAPEGCGRSAVPLPTGMWAFGRHLESSNRRQGSSDAGTIGPRTYWMPSPRSTSQQHGRCCGRCRDRRVKTRACGGARWRPNGSSRSTPSRHDRESAPSREEYLPAAQCSEDTPGRVGRYAGCRRYQADRHRPPGGRRPIPCTHLLTRARI